MYCIDHKVLCHIHVIVSVIEFCKTTIFENLIINIILFQESHRYGCVLKVRSK